MGNTATKDALHPPSIVTTEVFFQHISEKEIQHDEECTLQTEGSGSLLASASGQPKQPHDEYSVNIVTLDHDQIVGEDFDSVVSAITLNDSISSAASVRWWDGKKFFSNFVEDGLKSLSPDEPKICMVFENPCTSPQEATFFNGNTFKFHEFPPSPPLYKAVLTPCRYTMMNGSVYPSYLQGGIPPAGLVEHWKTSIPNFIEPEFVSEIPSVGKVYAYLPMESISNYVNDPHVHYHLCGKDALHLMTKNTPKLLANTQDTRPCICKTTHSMAGKGIFVIRNDEDEREFQEFISSTGNPTFVVTEFVEIERNVACHFFIHPNREGITWFGSNENRQLENGSWSPDSTIVKADQEYLREIQLPFVMDVVRYFQSLGFWGFCGVDVLFDKCGKGYLVDVNPRVTGSLPAIMVGHLLYEKYGYEYCLFRRSARYAYPGTAEHFMQTVEEYNEANIGKGIIVVNSFAEENPNCTLVQFGVYTNSGLEECQEVLDRLAPPNDGWKGED